MPFDDASAPQFHDTWVSQCVEHVRNATEADAVTIPVDSAEEGLEVFRAIRDEGLLDRFCTGAVAFSFRGERRYFRM